MVAIAPGTQERRSAGGRGGSGGGRRANKTGSSGRGGRGGRGGGTHTTGGRGTSGGGRSSSQRDSNNNNQRTGNNNNNHASTAIKHPSTKAAPVHGHVPPTKPNRMAKKAHRRQKQLEAMAQKAVAEDNYFRQCQIEARKEEAAKRNAAKAKGDHDAAKQQESIDKQMKARELELFSKQGSQGINFDKYNDIKIEVKHPDSNNKHESNDIMDNFTKLQDLTPALKRNIELMNYRHPTPIQKHAIPLAMAGNDLMCCAQTGSGKTCAFLLPVIAALSKQEGKISNKSKGSRHTKLKWDPAQPACVVLAPTRELASQIELEAQKLTHTFTNRVQPVCVYGGANARTQLHDLALASGHDAHLIIVATPGRLTEFVDRQLVSLDQVQFLVLDEADRMLDMGFLPQLQKLVQHSNMTPKQDRQTLLFSATFPPAIQTLAANFLRPYVWIAVGRVGSTTESITQKLVLATADKRHKLELVVQALQEGPDGRTLIFVQKKRTATWLKKQLNKGGPDNNEGIKYKHNHYVHDKQEQQPKPTNQKEIRFTPIPAEDIHGDRSQSQREAALAKFRSGKCNVLVATDVAARGLDISGVEHVINMDLPSSSEEFDSYIHRIGRTGRAGHTGLATSLFVPGDDPKLGNGRIAELLLAQLRESKQQVPHWLQKQVVGGGGGGNVNSGSAKPQFGGTDVRSIRSRATGGRGRDDSSGSEKKIGGHNGGGRGGGRGKGVGDERP